MRDETFKDWMEHEAPKDKRLRQLIKRAKSDVKLVAFIAGALLFIVFVFRIIKIAVAENLSLATSSKTESTTNEIVRKVIYDLEVSPVSHEQPILTDAKAEEKAEEKIGAENTLDEESTKTIEANPLEPLTDDKKSIENVVTNQRPSTTIKADTSNPRIAESLLEQMKEKEEKREQSLIREERSLRVQERVVFGMLIVAASITLMIVVTGVILIFRQRLAVGIVSEAVGLLPAAGTIILNRLSKNITQRMNLVTASREENLNTLQAIQTTLLIPDFDKRSDAIVSLASKLADRVTKSKSD